VSNLMAFSGRPRDLCIRALAAAFGDVNRAFEYVESGMIPNVGGGQQQQQPRPQAQA